MILREGISTRLRMMATAIAGGYAQAVWVRDDYCPATPAQIFPSGVRGLELIEVDAPPFPRLRTTRDRPKLKSAWATVWDALEIPEEPTAGLGVLFRGHYPGAVPFGTFKKSLIEFASRTTGPVAVLADSRRAEISAMLGSRAIPQMSREMADDMDRDTDQTLSYLREWGRFLRAESAITNCPQSSAMWPRTNGLAH